MEASRVSLLTTFLIFLICFVTCPLPPHKKHPRKTPLEHSSTFSSGHVKKSVSKRPSFGVSALAITEAEEEE